MGNLFSIKDNKIYIKESTHNNRNNLYINSYNKKYIKSYYDPFIYYNIYNLIMNDFELNNIYSFYNF